MLANVGWVKLARILVVRRNPIDCQFTFGRYKTIRWRAPPHRNLVHGIRAAVIGLELAIGCPMIFAVLVLDRFGRKDLPLFRVMFRPQSNIRNQHADQEHGHEQGRNRQDVLPVRFPNKCMKNRITSIAFVQRRPS